MAAILESIRSFFLGAAEEKDNNHLIGNGSEKQSNNPLVKSLGAQDSNQSTDVGTLFEMSSGRVFDVTLVVEELRKAFVNDSSSPKSVVNHNTVKIIITDILSNKNFKEYIDEEFRQICAQSIEQAKKITDKHIEGAVSCAYFTKDDKGLDVLNVHLDKPSLNEPIPISDILKVQEVVSELNIYGSSGKREVNAKRNKEIGTRNYNFEKGANYLMTIKWPVKIGNRLATCNMSVNINDSGITSIRGFEVYGTIPNGAQISIEYLLKLAEQNEELFINGCPLVEECKRVLGFKASEILVPLDNSFNSTQSSVMVEGNRKVVGPHTQKLAKEGSNKTNSASLST